MTYRSARPDSPPAALPLEDLIGEKDQCRVANAFVEALPRSSVEGRFRHPSGAPAFHPRMILKVRLYACATCGDCPAGAARKSKPSSATSNTTWASVAFSCAACVK